MAINLGAVLTILLVVGFLAQWLAWRMRLPAMLKPKPGWIVIALVPPTQDVAPVAAA